MIYLQNWIHIFVRNRTTRVNRTELPARNHTPTQQSYSTSTVQYSNRTVLQSESVSRIITRCGTPTLRLLRLRTLHSNVHPVGAKLHAPVAACSKLIADDILLF